MNADDVLEHELASHLRGQAMRAPSGDGWNGILARVGRRQRRRQRQRVVATTLCLVVLAAGLLSLRSQVGSDSAPMAAGPASPAPGTLPHLVLALPGFDLEHASEASFGPEDQPAMPSLDRVRLSVLTEPGRGYDGRVLFATTAAPGTAYGIGDRGSGAGPVDVDGRTAWIQRYTDLPVTSLGWFLADGQAVHLVALRMSDARSSPS